MSENSLESMLRFLRRTTELTADEARTVDGGWVFNTPSIDVAWGLNHVRFAAPVSFERATALADEAQSRLPYRRVVLEPDAVDDALEEEFRAAGWRAEHDLLMELRRPADREVETSVVGEPSEVDELELARRWTFEEAPDTTTEVMAALEKFWRREARARGDRYLGIPREHGSGIAAKAKLRSDGRIAQVEDVYVLVEARGHGLGRVIVTRAVELAQEAGHELIFIVADDDGWPKHLYGSIGFAPVGVVVNLHRESVPVNRPAPSSRSPRKTAQPSA
jgi:GNAT superfamily N-acetyltransferase